ncbi:MAG TPA: 2-C-methyl-D-erythritol 4-phosphate cytidylyltransferase [Candidatus Binatia bacterium]|nr:2-C-methyl-D-erythritol 4-phosphate cytidylyltransferase [Candidatus Binatia bacterium]
MRVSAIILAAGEGRRLGGSVPKAFASIAGRPLVLRTLERILSVPMIERATLVVGAAQLERCEALLKADPALRDRPWHLQMGAATRQQSAQRGLEQAGSENDLILIHDAARPFVSVELIVRCIEAAMRHDAAVPGLPAHDTIKVVTQDHWVERTLERDSLWEIQTPQVFRRELIVTAHANAARAGLDVSDDALAVERYGKPVFVVQGERLNFKITVPEDVWLAELLLREGRVS